MQADKIAAAVFSCVFVWTVIYSFIVLSLNYNPSVMLRVPAPFAQGSLSLIRYFGYKKLQRKYHGDRSFPFPRSPYLCFLRRNF